MNRCTPHTLVTVAVLAASAFLASCAHDTTGAGYAVRNFPPAALRGELMVQAPPVITLDGKPDRLSPGARIRDTNNMLVMSGTLVNQKVVVNYLRESAGNVHEVWILNSEEARLKRPNSKASWFSFGSSDGAPAAVKPN
ncbi:putative small secreted protein [Polaromonas sp. CG_9.5]|uniref:hypothetical protein n=1 Tax=Polaromonas sp. CG_9.5 TaxID=3071705 RepID=UPI002E0C41E7|nr:putative small secreted protein [Polaromonas sp. CG_9.5]